MPGAPGTSKYVESVSWSSQHDLIEAVPVFPIEAGKKVIATTSVRDEEATLFTFDDISIPFTYNLYLSIHRPRKHPDDPVLPLGEIPTSGRDITAL